VSRTGQAALTLGGAVALALGAVSNEGGAACEKGRPMDRRTDGKRILLLAATVAAAVMADAQTAGERIAQVSGMSGLTAFWTFGSPQAGVWQSAYDAGTSATSYPLYLRRIGDEERYTLDTWPYTDASSQVRVDASGPFGHAMYFNQGYIYAESPRAAFDNGPLDLNGERPFTLIAWMKFTGARHLVAGIWDEGGWDKYRGRRQAALFGGLFGRNGITAHISATGAASYPQSTVSGSQYARERALDGANFDNGQWVCMAMTFEPSTQQVKAWLNGVATPLSLGDPVENDVFDNANPKQANPYAFKWPVYSPRRFVLKYNGYNVRTEGVYEHWVEVRAAEGRFVYGRSAPGAAGGRFKVSVDVTRGGASLAGAPLEAEVEHGAELALAQGVALAQGDEIRTSLFVWQDEAWVRVGTEITYPVPEGAPFTLGRALGLGTEPLAHGAQLFIDGVAMFDRVLTGEELLAITFVDQPAPAGDGVWVNPAGGAWETAENWLDRAIANGMGATATFGNLEPAGDVAVRADASRMIGSLLFGGADNGARWLLSGETLMLAGAELPVVAVYNREAVVANNLEASQGFEKRGAGTLVLTGTNTSEAALSVTGGALALSNRASLASMRVALADGTILRVDGDAVFRSLENLGAGAPQVTVGGTARLGDGADRDGTTERVFAGAVSGGGALVKQGGNRQTLEGAAVVAAVEVAGGTLAVAPPGDIVAWFGFDDPGDIGRDAGPSGVSLTKEGENASWHEAEGKFGGALRLNGASCLIHDKLEAVPLRLPVGDAAFTIAAWIRRDADVPARGGIASWGQMDGSYNSAGLRMDGASAVIQPSAGHTAVALDAPGAWQHVALTYDPALVSGKRKIFVNGVLKRSDSPGQALAISTAFVAVGRGSPNSSEHQNQYFKGLLDEVVLARAAFSQAQLQALMTDGAAAFAAPPAAENLLPEATALAVGPSGRLVVGADQTVARIDGAGGVVALAGGATLTLAPTQDVTLASSVAGQGGLVKRGAGTTLTVAARQGYAGPTRVEEGTLEVLDQSPRTMEGIVGYWTFDDPADIGKDLGGNNIQMEVKGGTGGVTHYTDRARLGGCVLMSSRYLEPVGGYPEAMPTGNAAVSVSIWVNPSDSIGTSGGFAYWGFTNTKTRSSLNLRLNGSYTALTVASDSGNITVGNLGFDIRDGRPENGFGLGWHHLCYTYDPAHPTAKQKLYVNGALRATANQGDFRIEPVGLRINCGRSTTSNMGNGYIDDTILFSRAITEEEVRYLSAGNAVIPPAAPVPQTTVPGVVARYAFDDPERVGLDTSGFGNHLEAVGAGAVYHEGGKLGGALSVSAANSWLQAAGGAPAGFPVGKSAYTLACWFNPGDAVTNTGALFYLGRDADGASISGRFNSSHSSFILATLNVTQLSGATGYDLHRADLPAGWHHFVTTFDPALATAKRKMYIDGRLVASDNVTGVTLGTDVFHIGRGRSVPSTQFSGRIDEFVVMNRAATLAEISYLAAGMPEEQAGMLPWRTALQIDAGARAVFRGGTPNRMGGVSGAGELALEGTTSLAVGGGRTNVFAGTLTGASSVTVSGGAAQTLPLGAFTGTLAVSNATLLVTADGGAAAAGVAVAAGGRFGGVGATATPVAVAACGALLSRTGQAALTLCGGVALAPGAGFRVEVSGAQTEGNLKVSGALALPSTGFVELALTEERRGTFVVAEATGGVTVDGALYDWEISVPGAEANLERRLKVVDNRLVLSVNNKGLRVLVF
jgi:autotransporter-associated beta strand protein